ncbi:MAG: SpoIID/LytB domain-containing protein [Candidatus Eisenbacteria bacterium]
MAPDGPRLGIRLEVAGTAAPAGRGGLFSEPLIFEALSPDHPLTVEGKPYRGEILVRADSASGRLGIVNAVRIEEYLRGVVPLEMGSSEDLPLSALEAQAIAARSYALYYLGRRAQTHGCDLLAGPEDQVYGGIAAESPLACRAVAETWGIVALYGDRPIRANYCSTCGGRTDWNDRIWERQERVPYLRPIQDEMDGEALCTASPHYRWEECWTCEELARVVLKHLREEVPAARGQTIGRLRDIRVTGRSPSGRAEILAIVTEGGTYDVRGDRIRWVIRRADGALLRSTYFDDFERIDDDPCTIRLKGAGYGHGVGMCQFGAIELGRRGVGPGEILRHYYPGIGLARWW